MKKQKTNHFQWQQLFYFLDFIMLILFLVFFSFLFLSFFPFSFLSFSLKFPFDFFLLQYHLEILKVFWWSLILLLSFSLLFLKSFFFFLSFSSFFFITHLFLKRSEESQRNWNWEHLGGKCLGLACLLFDKPYYFEIYSCFLKEKEKMEQEMEIEMKEKKKKKKNKNQSKILSKHKEKKIKEKAISNKNKKEPKSNLKNTKRRDFSLCSFLSVDFSLKIKSEGRVWGRVGGRVEFSRTRPKNGRPLFLFFLAFSFLFSQKIYEKSNYQFVQQFVEAASLLSHPQIKSNQSI